MRKLIIGLLLVGASGIAEPSPSFWRALHLVETRGRTGPIKGDGGRALGPLQIHRGYWLDAGVKGKYEDCAKLDYSIKVASAYMQRYAPKAWRGKDHKVLARVHNGGPTGHKKKSTLAYWNKVRSKMK